MAAVAPDESRAGVKSIHDGELDPVDLDGAALVGPRYLTDVRALVAQPALHLDQRDDLRREPLRDLDLAAAGIGVAMGDGDDAGPRRLLLVFGAFRLVEPP